MIKKYPELYARAEMIPRDKVNQLYEISQTMKEKH
jgi:hypothetical protein